MDRVNVSAEALQSALHTLSNLRDSVNNLTIKYVAEITANLPNIDETLSVDIKKYIDAINELNKNIFEYCEKNKNAVTERLNKIPEYSKCAYIRRNTIV